MYSMGAWLQGVMLCVCAALPGGRSAPDYRGYRDALAPYGPAWLAALWPELRDGLRPTLAPSCWTDLAQLFRDTLDGRAWALGAADATGSYSSGLLWGNRYWLGSKEQCDDLDDRYLDFTSNTSRTLSYQQYLSTLNRQGETTGRAAVALSAATRPGPLSRELQARMHQADSTPPFRMAFSVALLQLNITRTTLFSRQLVWLGLCLPRACDAGAPLDLLELALRAHQGLHAAGTLPRSASVLRVRTLGTAAPDAALPALAGLLGCILVLIIIGTVIDVRTQGAPRCSAGRTSLPSPERLPSPTEDTGELELTARPPEPPRTVGGLAPNKYTPVVSGTNIPPDPAPSVDNTVHLVSVRTLVATERAPASALKVAAVGAQHPGSGAVSSELGGRGSRYVVSGGDPSPAEVDQLCGGCSPWFKASLDRSGLLAELLVCFSVKSNAVKIFSVDVGEGTLAPVHGLKLVTLLWVILVHTCLVVYQLSDNKVYRGVAETNIWYRVISNGSYSVDTFFVLSGALAAYLYCRALQEYSGRVPGKPLQLLAMLLYRYIRLSPPYLVTLWLAGAAGRFYVSRSTLELPDRDHSNCRAYWWRNMLYVNTLYPLREACMSWSWYLAADTQLFVLGSLLLVSCARRPRLLLGAGLLSGLAAAATSALVAARTGFVPSVQEPLAQYDALYDKPWTRAAPYLVGLGAGWLLGRPGGCFRLPQAAWRSSGLAALLALGALALSSPAALGGPVHAALAHPAWGLAVGWVLLACLAGGAGLVGSTLAWRRLFPLSRLSYCAYLLHPLLLKCVFLSAGAAQHLAPATLGVYFAGFVVLSFLCALPLCLAAEAPVVAMLRLLRVRRASPAADLMAA